MLELAEFAQERKAKPWAQYLGYAGTYDAVSLQGQNSEGTQLSTAISLALSRCDLTAEQVDGIVISADGRSQPDARIVRALADVFEYHLSARPVFAFSGTLGFLAGATEVFGALCASLILKHKTWPASPWFKQDKQLPGLTVPTSVEPFAGKIVLSITSDIFGVNYVHVFAKV